jgi:hypothetical protein
MRGGCRRRGKSSPGWEEGKVIIRSQELQMTRARKNVVKKQATAPDSDGDWRGPRKT